MCNAQPLSHSAPLFKKCNILTVTQLNQLQVAIFMYSFFKGILPPVFNDIFKLNSAIHHYNTRTQGNLHIPLCKYNFSRTTIMFIGTKCWNNIPIGIRECPTLLNFKHKYKKYLLSCET